MAMTRPQFFSKAGRASTRAFSLIEVVFALAICAFVLVVVMGLFMAGLQANQESEGEIQAANLASLIISSARATPVGPIANTPSCPIPAAALTNGFATVYENKYVGWDGIVDQFNTVRCVFDYMPVGHPTPSPGLALSHVYLLLSWPVQTNPANNPLHYYEISTYIPFP
ncbi:MAG: type II secretion system protein [Verrucomicrobiota bacterium]